MEKTLKQQLQEALNLPEDHFGRHETDLYVKYSKEVVEWLHLNYKYRRNVTKFHNQNDNNAIWLDIPFAAWTEKYPNQ